MWEVMEKGGMLMWPIMICSFVAIMVVVERLYFFRKISVDSKAFVESVARSVKRNRIVDALDMCDKTPGPIPTILKKGILKHDRPQSEIRDAIEDASLHEVPLLEKRLPVLATIAHITPLMGLLGTVTGMISAFQVIQEKASAVTPIDPGDLAGGIWQALLTTVVGLCVAIPTYVAYNYLTSRVDALVLDMEKSATNLLDILSERRDADGD